MKLLILLVAFTRLSFSQNKTSENVLANKTPCTFELTIDELTSKDLNFRCLEAFDNRSFSVENFRIKFEGHAPIKITGTALNTNAITLAETLKVGDYAMVSQIKNIVIGKENHQKFSRLKIKIVD